MRARNARRYAIASVTCAGLDIATGEDDALFAAACEEVNMTCAPLAWDGDDPWPAVDAAVLRSPWNYHLRPDAFRAWVRRTAAAVPLFNDAPTVLANVDKSYLVALASAGISTIPTHVVPRGSRADVARIAADRAWERIVVKPAISANGYLTTSADASHAADAQRTLDAILTERDALVQPMMDDVYQGGERCLIFIDGAFSHSVVKRPFAIDAAGTVPAEPRAADVALASRALSTLPAVPLYARVDVVRGADGAPCIMEMELVEPELYFRYAPDAAHRFAAGLRTRLDAIPACAPR